MSQVGHTTFLALPAEIDVSRSEISIFKWLLDRELIPFAALSTAALIDLSRRNVNFHVSNKTGRGLFLKIGIDQDHRRTLQREWDVIAGINEATCDDAPIAAHNIPKPIGHDAKCGIYAYEYIDRSISLRRLLSTNRVEPFADGLVSAAEAVLRLGNISIPPTVLARGPSRPLSFSFGRPKFQYASEFSAATFEFLRAVQSSSALLGLMEHCISLWSPEALSHFDVRFDNFLLVSKSKVFILDFEFACLGDAAWDFSCLVGQLIAAAVLSIDTTKAKNELSFDSDLMDTMQFTLNALNKRVLSGPENHTRNFLLSRLPYFAVAHVLQMLYELTLGELTLSRHVVLGIQLSENIARHPEVLANVFV